MVIGSLLIIVFGLLFILSNNGFQLFPLWVKQAIVAGFTTLVGAFIGAFLAGQFAILSVNKQMDFLREQKNEDDKDKSIRSLRIICYELMMMISFANSLLNDLSIRTDFGSIKRISKLMTENNHDFKNLFRDTSLMTTVSNENFHFVYTIPNIIHIFDEIDLTIQLSIFENHHEECDRIIEDISNQISKLEEIRDSILKEIRE